MEVAGSKIIFFFNFMPSELESRKNSDPERLKRVGCIRSGFNDFVDSDLYRDHDWAEMLDPYPNPD
jgi:hypothetical protein